MFKRWVACILIAWHLAYWWPRLYLWLHPEPITNQTVGWLAIAVMLPVCMLYFTVLTIPQRWYEKGEIDWPDWFLFVDCYYVTLLPAAALCNTSGAFLGWFFSIVTSLAATTRFDDCWLRKPDSAQIHENFKAGSYTPSRSWR